MDALQSPKVQSIEKMDDMQKSLERKEIMIPNYNRIIDYTIHVGMTVQQRRKVIHSKEMI